MIDDTKPAFEFDPLPGDNSGRPGVTSALEEHPLPHSSAETPIKRRGRPKKTKVKKAVRAKRGPRKVAPHIEARAAVVEQQIAKAAELPVRKARKKRVGKHTADEYDIIGQLMLLTASKRKRVLAALNKVFG